jgi:H+/gluconate symporter-like permease
VYPQEWSTDCIRGVPTEPFEEFYVIAKFAFREVVSAASLLSAIVIIILYLVLSFRNKKERKKERKKGRKKERRKKKEKKRTEKKRKKRKEKWAVLFCPVVCL